MAAPHLVCSITHEVMTDPVFVDTGHTFERSAIEKWQKEHGTNPLTGEKISSKVTVNWLAREQIDQWRKENGLPEIERKRKRAAAGTWEITFTHAEECEPVVGISGDGKTVFISSFDVVKAYTKTLDEWRCVSTSPTHDDRVYMIAVSGNGKVVVTADKTRKIWIWKHASNTWSWTSYIKCDMSYLSAMVLSNDGKHLFAGGSDDKVTHVSINSSGHSTVKPFIFACAWTRALSLNADASLIAMGAGVFSKVFGAIWDTGTCTRVKQFSCFTGTLRNVALSPDGRLLMASAQGEAVQVWKLCDDKWTKTATLPHKGDNVLAISGDGQLCMVARSGSKSIHVLSMDTYESEETLSLEDAVQYAAMSRDGSVIVCRTQKKVFIWEH